MIEDVVTCVHICKYVYYAQHTRESSRSMNGSFYDAMQ